MDDRVQGIKGTTLRARFKRAIRLQGSCEQDMLASGTSATGLPAGAAGSGECAFWWGGRTPVSEEVKLLNTVIHALHILEDVWPGVRGGTKRRHVPRLKGKDKKHERTRKEAQTDGLQKRKHGIHCRKEWYDNTRYEISKRQLSAQSIQSLPTTSTTAILWLDSNHSSKSLP